MSTRIDASTDYLQRTANLPATGAFTACCWFYYVATRSDYAYFLGLENADVSGWLLLGFDNSNTFQVSVSSGTEADFGANPATSAWHFMAIRANGANVKGFHRTLAGTWQTATTGTAPSFTVARLQFGADSVGEWVNCRVAAMKVWDAALSDAEIENEALTFLPQRTSNLNLWVPSFAGATERARDYGPNGRDLTQNGTLTDEDMPPLGWGTRPYVIVPTSGGVTVDLEAHGVGMAVGDGQAEIVIDMNGGAVALAAASTPGRIVADLTADAVTTGAADGQAEIVIDATGDGVAASVADGRVEIVLDASGDAVAVASADAQAETVLDLTGTVVAAGVSDGTPIIVLETSGTAVGMGIGDAETVVVYEVDGTAVGLAVGDSTAVIVADLQGDAIGLADGYATETTPILLEGGAVGLFVGDGSALVTVTAVSAAAGLALGDGQPYGLLLAEGEAVGVTLADGRVAGTGGIQDVYYKGMFRGHARGMR